MAYVVQEVALGGEIFDFVATGPLPEKISRMYFKQLIAGLSFLHQNGVFHRDIKPENVLLSSDLTLKIADFGFSKHISQTHAGITRTRLGTEPYMSPEILYGQAYSPASGDLFAAGVILFILYAGYPPFGRALSNDQWYSYLWTGQYDKFWYFHARNKPAGYYPESFKALINGLLSRVPDTRLHMHDVEAHAWLQDPAVATIEEAQELFAQRGRRLVSTA